MDKHTHTHTHIDQFNGQFPRERGLAGCFIHSVPPVILKDNVWR